MDSSLEQFIHTVSGDEYFRVEDDLGNGFVRLRAAEAQRRQALQDIRSFEDVIIELLRNARDAHAHAIFVATWTEDSKRFVTMLDDGDGIPASMHQTVFEPFVTSKLDSFHSDKWGVHGRGMALYSIKQNVSAARILASETGLGSVFHIESDLNRLGEKRDQSTYPTISKNAEGKPILRGPHNIIRTVMEFAIEERNHISVYLGSSAQVVSTLYHLGSSAASKLSYIFENYDETTPYLQRFAYVDDAESLANLANSLGFPLSQRSAHRILNGEIKPLPLHLEYLRKEGKPSGRPTSTLKSSDKGKAHLASSKISFSKEDLAGFSKAVMHSYDDLAEAYYLDKNVEPNIAAKSGNLIISIPLHSRDFTGDS